MDEPEFETQYERVVRQGKEQKYRRDFGPGRPASMQKGTDMAPVYFIGFAVVMFLLLFYFDSQTGG